MWLRHAVQYQASLPSFLTSFKTHETQLASYDITKWGGIRRDLMSAKSKRFRAEGRGWDETNGCCWGVDKVDAPVSLTMPYYETM